MISVDEVLHILKAANFPDRSISLALTDAVGKTLAEDIIAPRAQPVFPISAMDGYALQFSDIEAGREHFPVMGEAKAGAPFTGEMKSGTAVRIFTGAILPPKADHVIIQEEVKADDTSITITVPQAHPRNIRAAGIDFSAGQVLLSKGKKLTAYDLAVIAAANYDKIKICKPPVIAFFASGDELRPPGSPLHDTQIADAISAPLAALITKWGATPLPLPIVSDDIAQFHNNLAQAETADIIVPIGGASVGKYDFAKPAFAEKGYQMLFEKIAVKPGKPTWFAQKDHQYVLGLPGNPASALVCAHIFLQSLIGTPLTYKAKPKTPLAAGGGRAEFMRGVYEADHYGQLWVTPLAQQDSGLTHPFTKANCLIHHPANMSETLINLPPDQPVDIFPF